MTRSWKICPFCKSYLSTHPSAHGLLKCCCGFTKYEKPMIKLEELNKHNYPTDETIDANLSILLDKMNSIRLAYGKPMIVTSGLRSQEQQDQLIKDGKSNAPKSKHLTGEACDILDEMGDLWYWIGENMELLEHIGLWLEDRKSTPTWVHFQVTPPASGKRIFKP